MVEGIKRSNFGIQSFSKFKIIWPQFQKGQLGFQTESLTFDSKKFEIGQSAKYKRCLICDGEQLLCLEFFEFS